MHDAAQAGAQVLLALDCGSGADDHQPIQLARDLGMRVIVCDHHHPHPGNPADHHINPRLHHDGQESASVVALKLAWALDMALAASDTPRPRLLGQGVWVAAFGARADMMNMDDPENAALLDHGKAAVARCGYPVGLEYLARLMGHSDVEKAHKTIGGCLNMPKRTHLADAADVGTLLAAMDDAAAHWSAQRLVSVHQQSKGVLNDLLSASVDKARADVQQNPSQRVLVAHLDGPGIRAFPGYAGLVANRIAQDQKRPAVAIAHLGDGTVKWSARLDRRVGRDERGSLLSCLAELQEIGNAGGHPGAVSGACAADQAERIVEILTRWAGQDPNPATDHPGERQPARSAG